MKTETYPNAAKAAEKPENAPSKPVADAGRVKLGAGMLRF